MRQDPDVILLGEIRDTETAELSMKLASTGHLVLSTIHANGAVEVVDRLKNLGVDQYTIQTNLRLSVAQRLVRLLCPNCALPASNLEACYRELNSNGCLDCYKGVTGRAAVIEFIERQELPKINSPNFKISKDLASEYEALARIGKIDVNDAVNAS